MKRATVALRSILREAGSEGVLLLVGTACLAVAASFIGPAGPWLVVGVMATILGFIRMIVSLAVAFRRRRAE